MMLISEKYKNRLRKLAGILTEVVYDFNAEEREKAFVGFEKRVKYDKDLMVKAIREGWEVGILFYSKNDKYQMRTYKSRIICPVALGISKKGNSVLRAFHKIGQSEGAGLKQKGTGEKNWRSTEVKDEWRLFKISNISRMWLTGRFFQVGELRDSRNGATYSTGKDKAMPSVEIQFNSSVAKKFQDEYNKKSKEPAPVIPVNQGKKVAMEPNQPEKPGEATAPIVDKSKK
jgi:hypothetical protein